MLNKQPKSDPETVQLTSTSEMLDKVTEQEESRKGNWREVFRTAFERARRQQKPIAGRQELGRDKSKALLLVVGAMVALLLLFFGMFSSPKQRIAVTRETPSGLARTATPGQANGDSTKAVTPMLSADVHAGDTGLGGRITPEDVGRTSRTGVAASTVNAKPSAAQDYALGRVDFSDPLVGKGDTIPPPPPAPTSVPPSANEPGADLKKPSLIFVRALDANPAIKPSMPDDDEQMLLLPAGTRLIARLQSPVSSAVVAPVVAVVEYNYERNGQIVLPAGAKVLGRLVQVSPSGYVAIQFHQVEMPDGTPQKIEASAMDLNFSPLKGYVSGKKTGTKFLVRSLTGLGTVASYLVGPQGSTSAGLISTNSLLRERLADNVATAGEEKLNGLAYNQNLVVTVPGNTRFYIIVQKPTSDRSATNSGMRSASTKTAAFNRNVPTLEELRQLIQLRSEINELYSQGSSQSSVVQPQSQQ